MLRSPLIAAALTCCAIALPAAAPGTLPDPQLVTRLRRAMTAGVGVVRTEAGMQAALREIAGAADDYST